MKALWLAPTLLAGSYAFFDVPQTPAPSVAFIGVTVLPMYEGSRAVPDLTVVVEGGRITSIALGGEVHLPPSAQRIDGRGKFLMPGLADMHVHLEYFETPAVLAAFLANGVTTVRSMDGRPYILEWKKKTASGELLGPTIYTAGPLLDGDPPLRPDNTVVRNATEAREAVAAQAKAGYDFIKVYGNLSPESYNAILEEAKARKLPVAGHVPRRLTIDDVLASGQASIEHLNDYDDAIEAEGSPFKGRFHWSKPLLGIPIDPAKLKALAAKQARSGVRVVPTVVQPDRALAPADRIRAWLSEPEMTLIPADGLAIWQKQVDRSTSRMNEEDWKLVERGRANRLEALRALHAAGVPLLAGTDTPNPYLVPGFSLGYELENFTAAGLGNAETLAIATREAARFIGALNDSGTIETGKRADLLLLDANPLDDVKNVRKIAGVMVRGRWLPREKLNEMLTPMR